MTTYSGEDGMTGTDQPGQPVPPGDPRIPDDLATPVSEPAPAFQYPYPEDEHSYNATDVLPAPLPGGRRARRQAEEEARAAAGPTGAKAVMSGTPSGPGRVIVPAALAIVSAVALAAAWMHLESDRASGVTEPLPAASASQQPSPVSSPSTAPSASASSQPSASPSAKPSTATSASASAPVSPTASAKPVGTVDRSVPVVVLNGTQRPGLAAKVAAKLRAEGWKVTSVGNWTKGGVDATTIFLNGHVAARDTMIKDLPAADGRVELPLAGMPKLRLVVVVGKDYPA